MNYFKLVKNKVMLYLVSRYITYFVQFLTSLIIAAKLGPYYMGVWGFILLLLQYFQQIHFGIGNSFNVLYVHNKDNKKECDNFIANSFVLLTYLSILVVCFYVYYLVFGIESFDKYHIDKYLLYVCLIAILQYFVQFLINLFRVKGLLNHVAFSQSIIIFLTFFSVFFFREESLIVSLIGSYLIGNLLCIFLAFVSGILPRKGNVTISVLYQETIVKKGLFLFLYNSCFYFIIISIRTIISVTYEVEEFGLFTFSFTLAHAVLLILEALSFVIFPKVLSKLSSNDTDVVKNTISFLRLIYITSAHLLIYIAMILFPLFILFLPKYENALTSLNLIALAILMYTNVTGYSDLLIAKNKEKRLSIISFGGLILNCTLGVLLVKVFYVSFSYVILATMVTYMVYSFCIMYFGEKLLKEKLLRRILYKYFPIRLFIPYLSAFLLSLMRPGNEYMFIPLLLFLFLNIKQFSNIKEAILKIIHQPEVVNI